MTIKIDKKIVGYRVVTHESTKSVRVDTTVKHADVSQFELWEKPTVPLTGDPLRKSGTAAKRANVIRIHKKVEQPETPIGTMAKRPVHMHMHESVERPEMLIGSTYKVKTPENVSLHALYITINDIVLNPGTEHELHRPFEVFINSKSMDHFQWIVALTRIISAVFRKGGDVTFLVEELRSVFDPSGGYWKKGGKFMPSLVAEIGDVIEKHMIKIGLIEPPELDQHQKKLIEEKRTKFTLTASPNDDRASDQEALFPSGASLCKQCSTKAVILMDGCMTCLNCGDSKCG